MCQDYRQKHLLMSIESFLLNNIEELKGLSTEGLYNYWSALRGLAAKNEEEANLTFEFLSTMQHVDLTLLQEAVSIDTDHINND
ncbi:MAG: hypothetical protein GX969_08880 [Firmicutes bacterium]|nr:hypothetical protein [Bacillota bacterium]